MIEVPSSPQASGPVPGASWRWPVAFMVVAALALAAGIYVFESCRRLPGDALAETTRLVKAAGEEAAKVANAFRQGHVTTTFTSYATTVAANEYLQVATLKQTEVFTRKDEASVAFGLVPLPDVIVQATAPVSYTYFLDLNGQWSFRLENHVIEVVAPLIQFNQPAVDASHITYEVKKDSVLRRSAEAMDDLKESITTLSYIKARANLPLVRETARREVQTFVENWVARSFSDGKAYAVKVQFRNEVAADGSKRLAPTVDGVRVNP